MRLMEVGTKELKKGKKQEAQDLFKKSFHLYSLFWGLVLKATEIAEIKDEVHYFDEKGNLKGTSSVFDKLGDLIKKALDCCRE
jgi:hypothetical protein